MSEVAAYLAVLGGAITPWFELFVIPPAIALGLNPVGVALIAFAANTAATVAVVAGWERIAAWRERRRGRPLVKAGGTSRGQRVFERYGVPGLGLQAPLISGMYLAALIALSLGASRRSVVVWAVVGNAVWAVALAVGTVGGAGFFT